MRWSGCGPCFPSETVTFEVLTGDPGGALSEALKSPLVGFWSGPELRFERHERWVVAGARGVGESCRRGVVKEKKVKGGRPGKQTSQS